MIRTAARIALTAALGVAGAQCVPTRPTAPQAPAETVVPR
jgi:hypothetical protein